jgi:hypothetical protein
MRPRRSLLPECLQAAQLADQYEPIMRIARPHFTRTRCEECALSPDTIANRSEVSVLELLQNTQKKNGTFCCHVEPNIGKICCGFVILQHAPADRINLLIDRLDSLGVGTKKWQGHLIQVQYPEKSPAEQIASGKKKYYICTEEDWTSPDIEVLADSPYDAACSFVNKLQDDGEENQHYTIFVTWDLPTPRALTKKEIKDGVGNKNDLIYRGIQVFEGFVPELSIPEVNLINFDEESRL